MTIMKNGIDVTEQVLSDFGDKSTKPPIEIAVILERKIYAILDKRIDGKAANRPTLEALAMEIALNIMGDASTRKDEERNNLLVTTSPTTDNKGGCREALKWLIALKVHKDEHGKTPHYEEMQPRAWAAAKMALATPEAEAESEPVCYEDDGCPMETAVLKRFWREHQKAPEQTSEIRDNYELTQSIEESLSYFCDEFPKQSRPEVWGEPISHHCGGITPDDLQALLSILYVLKPVSVKEIAHATDIEAVDVSIVLSAAGVKYVD